MLKNITLSADERLIELARKKARNHRTTINDLFRQWLAHYASDRNLPAELDNFLAAVSYCEAGRSFTRDELNAR